MARAGSSSSTSPATCRPTCSTRLTTRKGLRRPPTKLPYLVHSPEDRSAMLETIGVSSMNDLLVDIPQTLRLESLQLPAGPSELQTTAPVTAHAHPHPAFTAPLTVRRRRLLP